MTANPAPSDRESPQRVGVVGSGTMGAGIAQIAALGGFETHLHDPFAEALAKGVERIESGLAKGAERGRWSEAEAAAARERLRPCAAREELARCELVIEAVPEQLELKRELLAALAGICEPGTVLATNTSSLSVTAIAAGVPEAERVVGMHFFNPPPLMRLVEIVSGDETAAEVAAAARAAAERMGRTPIDAADGIGFLANRLARPYTLEGLRILAEGQATVEAIDRACRTLAGFRMGPFELIDLVGVDVNLAVAKSFWEQSFHEPRWQPSPIQQRLVDAGRLGRKSGRGFYDYTGGPHRPDDPEADPQAPGPGELLAGPLDELGGDRAILARILAQIVNEAHFAVAAGAGTEADADTAMRLGFNWPRGPFELTEELGAARALEIVDHLWETRREERYRAAPLLRERAG